MICRGLSVRVWARFEHYADVRRSTNSFGYHMLVFIYTRLMRFIWRQLVVPIIVTSEGSAEACYRVSQGMSGLALEAF